MEEKEDVNSSGDEYPPRTKPMKQYSLEATDKRPVMVCNVKVHRNTLTDILDELKISGIVVFNGMMAFKFVWTNRAETDRFNGTLTSRLHHRLSLLEFPPYLNFVLSEEMEDMMEEDHPLLDGFPVVTKRDQVLANIASDCSNDLYHLADLLDKGKGFSTAIMDILVYDSVDFTDLVEVAA